jgi:ubiquinone/menaquinone biosynthesis C-methylase UbiE
LITGPHKLLLNRGAKEGGITMPHRVCPWWIGYLLASPIRRWLEIKDPEAFLNPYVKPGMCVFEPGPGMGFFTISIAKLVGPSGVVIAADIQPQMLNVLRNRAEKAGVMSRIETRVVSPDRLGIADLEGRVDFVLAWAMVHELPSADNFFAEVAATLKPDGKLLFGEPSGHVDAAQFAWEIEAAQFAGLIEVQRVSVPRSTAALLVKRT